MKKLFFASVMFAGGAVFGLAMAAIVVAGLVSFGKSGLSSGVGSSSTPDVVVTVSERHINALIDRQVGNSPDYKDIRVEVEPGNSLVATGSANVAGISLPVQVRANLFTDGEGVKVKVVETKVGVLPIKVDLAGVIEEPMAAATRDVLPLDRYRVSGVATQAGSVTVDLVER